MTRKELEALGAVLRLLLERSRDRYRGIWACEGIEYRKGDMVTYKGSLWRCLLDKATDQEPGGFAGAWHLIVRRGAKGNEGKPAPAGELKLMQANAAEQSRQLNELSVRLEAVEAVAHVTQPVVSGKEFDALKDELRARVANIVHRLANLEQK